MCLVCPLADPVACPGAQCCPTDHPTCCGDGLSCGTTLQACAAGDAGGITDDGSDDAIGGGGDATVEAGL
jgi:hypothetical protein